MSTFPQSITMKQSASQLVYRLLDGQADLLPLRILDSRDVAWLDWNVSFHILGASHAAVLRRGETCVTELLTCVSQESALPTLVDLQAGERNEGCASVHGLTCRVRITPFSLKNGDALHGRFVENRQFAIAFPGDEAGATPVTRIGWHQDGPTLTVETVHSYPEEGRGVRSVSLFVQEAER